MPTKSNDPKQRTGQRRASDVGSRQVKIKQTEVNIYEQAVGLKNMVRRDRKHKLEDVKK